MTAPLLVIGLDAAEPAALAGLPFLGEMARRGATGRLVGLHEHLTDTVWPELRTGRSGVRTGTYYAPLQFRSGEARARPRTYPELEPDRFYWNLAAEAGARVIAVDQPLAPGRPEGPEAEIAGWGTHDRPFGLHCRDPRLARLLEDVGPHPIAECNRINDGSDAARRRLLALIHAGIDRRTELLAGAMRVGAWDLFTAVYGESHCAGHHFWPMREGEPGDPERARPGTEVIDAVYRHLDAAIGELVSASPSGTTVIVYTSHGMGPTDEGAFLVGDVLERLGMVPANRVRRRAAALVPERVRGVIRRVIGGRALQRAGLTADRGFGDPSTRAVPLPNSRHGAIRLALAGRDPGGRLVAGSPEHRSVLADIRDAFHSLRVAPGGEAAVVEVVETDELFGRDRHPDLPDVIIRFRSDLGVLAECVSPRLGTIRLIRHSHRTGEHGTPGAIWMMGPGITPGASLHDVRAVDFAPTVLSHLGVPIPDWIDGTPRHL